MCPDTDADCDAGTAVFAAAADELFCEVMKPRSGLRRA